MKQCKKACIFIIMFVVVSFLSGCTSYYRNFDGNYEYKYDDVKDILIRFHVIANSDSSEDQDIKLKVKDAVINYIFPYLKDSKSLDESRKILNERKDDILKISENIIKENGYNYNAIIDFSKENFPEKNYGNIILPAGEYEAFRIIIGRGEGHNWWCVMFPPMCFVDVTKGKVEEEESKEELDEEIYKNKKDESKEDDSKEDNNQDEDIEIKFKILEIFK